MIENDCIIMTSGSKFFRSPAHTGAVFVPPQIMKRLQQVKKDDVIKETWDGLVPKSLNSYFGKNEFPRELEHWRDELDDN